MHDKYNIKFDVPRMFEHFGGAVEVEKLIRLHRLPPKPLKTLQKQRERGDAPADMVATLLYLSHMVGQPMDLNDYLIKRVRK